MAASDNLTKQQHGEFEIHFGATEMEDGSWKVHVQVYKGATQIDQQTLHENFQTKVLAEQAGLAYGRERADRWIAEDEEELADDKRVVQVGTSSYRFDSVEEANGALQWLSDISATPEQFAAKYGKFRLTAPALGRKKKF